jgi:anti-sigma regulatory factor (Ser/Thr protein kinase)
VTVCGGGVFAAGRGKRSNPSLVGYPKGKRAEVASAEPSRVLRQRLPAVPASVRAARIAATSFAKSHGATDERLLSDIALCVSEVASNVVVHAYPDTRGEISLTIRQTRADLIVEIGDQGAGAASRTPPPGLGLGLGIVHALSDGTTDHNDEEGHHVTMRFRLHPDQGTG